VAIALCTSVGCARPGPPPGGPADTTPPEIVRVFPADGETRVDLDTVIEVEFSEEMARSSAEGAFGLTPEVALRSLRWKGTVLIAEPEEALPDSMTFVASIGEAAKDYHGVRIARAYSFAFATGDAVAAGTLAGTVTVLEEPFGGALVWACEGDVTTDSLGVIAPCAHAATSAEDGTFVLDNVRSSPSAYSLVAFVDRNGDGRYETGTETGWVVPTVARVAAPGDSVGGLSIEMRAPAGRGAEPGPSEAD
jgi:hypothetical protein